MNTTKQKTDAEKLKVLTSSILNLQLAVVEIYFYVRSQRAGNKEEMDTNIKVISTRVDEIFTDMDGVLEMFKESIYTTEDDLKLSKERLLSTEKELNNLKKEDGENNNE